MTKEQWLQLFTDKGIDTSLYDFRVRNGKYGNEIWCYKKDGMSQTKRVATGNIFVDGKKYKYKSDEYFERCQKPYSEIVREYKQVNNRMGIVVVESDLSGMNDDFKCYFY